MRVKKVLECPRDIAPGTYNGYGPVTFHQPITLINGDSLVVEYDEWKHGDMITTTITSAFTFMYLNRKHPGWNSAMELETGIVWTLADEQIIRLTEPLP